MHAAKRRQFTRQQAYKIRNSKLNHPIDMIKYSTESYQNYLQLSSSLILKLRLYGTRRLKIVNKIISVFSLHEKCR